MKHSLFLSIFLLIHIQSFGQRISGYPFEFEKSGNGMGAIVLIPGFAFSGEVWSETKAVFEKGFTCYTLTMAGFADPEPRPNPSFEDLRTRIADLIKSENMVKPILIGYNMGWAGDGNSSGLYRTH
ncbi:alpha/beta fold hydrolase [Gelidibacter sp. F63206]|uniref:alpha/beta fold hydrolase n=1 Tax=Gelidibacter sp. F63206 TaxID=2926425 RepID=UPI001FF20D65|nr:alpha/beta hydrolase [Gelidibacter sp. F63206]MCK0114914.1 alpha/beta hydrolase [Gelidibacter sp. F63206]